MIGTDFRVLSQMIAINAFVQTKIAIYWLVLVSLAWGAHANLNYEDVLN